MTAVCLLIPCHGRADLLRVLPWWGGLVSDPGRVSISTGHDCSVGVCAFLATPHNNNEGPAALVAIIYADSWHRLSSVFDFVLSLPGFPRHTHVILQKRAYYILWLVYYVHSTKQLYILGYMPQTQYLCGFRDIQLFAKVTFCE
jgi:hypothetical protein